MSLTKDNAPDSALTPYPDGGPPRDRWSDVKVKDPEGIFKDVYAYDIRNAWQSISTASDPTPMEEIMRRFVACRYAHSDCRRIVVKHWIKKNNIPQHELLKVDYDLTFDEIERFYIVELCGDRYFIFS